MSAFFIAAYDVTNPEEYAKYNPGSMGVILETITRHGGKVKSASGDSHWIASERQVVVIIEFPSIDAAKAWESDPDYQPAKKIRHGATGNRFEAIAPEFVPPSA